MTKTQEAKGRGGVTSGHAAPSPIAAAPTEARGSAGQGCFSKWRLFPHLPARASCSTPQAPHRRPRTAGPAPQAHTSLPRLLGAASPAAPAQESCLPFPGPPPFPLLSRRTASHAQHPRRPGAAPRPEGRSRRGAGDAFCGGVPCTPAPGRQSLPRAAPAGELPAPADLSPLPPERAGQTKIGGKSIPGRRRP